MGQLAKLINTASEVFAARSRHKAASEAKARPLRLDLDIVPDKKGDRARWHRRYWPETDVDTLLAVKLF